jgi:nicotinamide riboside kinase
MRKFALIGTSCVGKTTLLHEVSTILKETFPEKKIVAVHEAARQYFEKRSVRNPFSFTHQSRIQALAQEFEKEAQRESPDIILCDRSVLDAIAYVNTMGTKTDVKKLIRNVNDWLATYTNFFLLDPADIEYKTDPIRRESKRVREAFHTSFLDILNELRFPFTIISGSKKRRIRTMISIISPAAS